MNHDVQMLSASRPQDPSSMYEDLIQIRDNLWEKNAPPKMGTSYSLRFNSAENSTCYIKHKSS